LREHGWEVVDPVKRKGRKHCIEGICRVWNELFVLENFAGEVDIFVERKIGVSIEET